MSSKGSALAPKAGTLTQRRKSKQKNDDPTDIPSPTSPAELAGELDPAAKTLKANASGTGSPRSSGGVGGAGVLTVALTKLDVLLMLVLLAVAAAVRLHDLTAIDTVVFDEVHYINFTKHILRGRYFFDVNPVFGKLAVAFVAKLFGFDPSGPDVTLGQQLSHAQMFAVRVPSVIFGSLSVPVFYRICRLLHLSTYASVVGACFMLFDHMHVIQSRITMVDAVLVFYSCLSMLCALCLWDAKNVVVIKRRRVSARDAATVAFYLLVTGVNCGLTLSTRWTAFAAPLLIFVVSMYGVGPFCLEPLHIFELLILYGSAAVAYAGSFAAFLLQVRKTGPGDNFMDAPFRTCLEGRADNAGGCQLGLLRRIWELNVKIFNYSKEIRGKDKWGSSWFQWMLNWRGALYYRHPGQDKTMSMIYVLMNPAMSVILNLLTMLFIAVLFVAVRYRKQYPVTDALRAHMKRGGLLFFGWIGSMLPTMVVYRSGPIYQYLPGLFFAQGLGAVGFDLVPRRGRPVVAALLIAAMAGAFSYWSPWVYATPISPMDHFQMRWMPKWD